MSEASPTVPVPAHTLHICVTCRPKGASPEAVRDGRLLYEAVAALHADWPGRDLVALNGVECMSGCDRACTVALSGAGKPSYLFCDKAPTPETAAAALDLAAQYAASDTGVLMRGDRPGPFRSGILAKIPPGL
ncbi:MULTISPECIES: DUF1636 family protein [Nitrospirillum]|uniref:Putative metal-binding protein n=1 Tax=Nitrospirillum amazonense TaxID=28077 RepID=A0A560FH81_9PROT|nr:DUF1636 domain-containing protein [Nitrospirillum amazonense]MEC4589816.1 DUF1636 domain-containing protein [Nitrospirillum amazonense]TWB20972.1 putative metal-binding protein [Nitrospirillum amazonense]